MSSTSFSRLVWLLVCLSLLSCSKDNAKPSLLTLGGLTMGTSYTVKINENRPDLSSEELYTGINKILSDVNSKMSTYLEDSELSLLNRAAAMEWIPVSEDLYRIINDAKMISALSAGSFDVTVGPLVNLWGFGPDKENQHIPSPELISETRVQTGIQHIQLRASPPAVRKAVDGIYIDLSGIAKGFAVDRITEYLLAMKIENFMVEIGGEIRAMGVNDIGFAWRIGIEQPLPGQRTVQRIIKLDHTAMATSGDYRNYFEVDGKRYSHTIDPRTGRPVAHQLASVTVLHASATWADALATGFLVLGRDQAWEIATREKLAVLFLERNGSGFIETYTDEFRISMLDN